jgi:predicted translin family RNA/ssDNA-binding protein
MLHRTSTAQVISALSVRAPRIHRIIYISPNPDEHRMKKDTRKQNQSKSASVLPSALLSDMKSLMEKELQIREEVISATRDITRQSKTAIYSMHREDLSSARETLKGVGAHILWVSRKVALLPTIQGIADQGYEEYAEAMCFLAIMEGNPLPAPHALGIPLESYLGGLCDLTGELMRETVIAGTKGDRLAVAQYHALTNEIHGLLIQLDLRNGELRKKSDSIKWNLLKIEQVLYDLAMRPQHGRT